MKIYNSNIKRSIKRNNTFDPISAHFPVVVEIGCSVGFDELSPSPKRFTSQLLEGGFEPEVSVPSTNTDLSRQTFCSHVKNVQHG